MVNDIYVFKVKYTIDEVSKPYGIVSGVLHADCYGDAAEQIYDYFEESLIEILKLAKRDQCDEDARLIFLPEDIANNFADYDFDPLMDYEKRFDTAEEAV